MADKVYYCNNCGGVMMFDVKTQTLKCPNCDTQAEIENDTSKIIEHKFTKNIAKKISVAEKTSSTMQCKGCGATVEVAKDCTATECAYCGTKYVLAEKQLEAIVPDGVIPFKIDKHTSKEIFTKWINKRWLAPGSLKNLYEHDKMQGIYLPYWTFDADAEATYTAEGGENRTVEKKNSDGSTTHETVTDWYMTNGYVEHSFDDILIKASNNLKPNLLKGIEPFDTINSLASYSPEYLSGYSAECYTVSIDTAHNEAISLINRTLKNDARDDVLRHYDEVRNVNIVPKYSNETYKHVLLPVYATAFNYNGKTYPVLINGETGKIKGSYPKSVVKIVLIIVAIIGVIVAIVMFSKSGNKNDNNTADVAFQTPAITTTVVSNSENVYAEYYYDEDNNLVLVQDGTDNYEI